MLYILQNRGQFILGLFLILLLYFSWLLQGHLLLNWDVSFLYYASKKMLLGGTYTENFFETNTPLILFLYLPPVIISKFLSFSEVTTFNGYIFGLGILSLALIGKTVINNFVGWKSSLILLSFATCFFILPLHHFGQREHLLVMLITPFIFLVRSKLLLIKVNRYYAAICAFMAVLGFLIKPFFIITFIFLEGYALTKDRHFLRRQQLELSIIFLVMIMYLLSVWVFFNDYVTIIIPILQFLYFVGFADNWKTLVTEYWVLYSVAIILFYFLTPKKIRSEYEILFISLLSCLFIYFLERIDWYYHLIPAISFALVLGGLLLGSLIEYYSQQSLKIIFFIKNIVVVTMMTGMVFYIPFIILLHDMEYILSLNKGRKQFIHYVNEKIKKDSMYFISTSDINFPVFYYSQAKPIIRFPSYWMLPGLVNLSQLPKNIINQQKLNDINQFFLTLVAKDIADKKPQWIFLDARYYNFQLKTYNFDLIKYFLQNALFKHNWENYRYVDSVYYYKVYQHI